MSTTIHYSKPALGGFLAATFAAGAIGSLATFKNVKTWYPQLAKPDWNPPDWVFGPVWTILYILMAVAIWRAWSAARLNHPGAARGLVVGYGLQLAANALWSVLFFGLKQPAWALVDIAVLWGLIVWMQVRLHRFDRVASGLWLPYGLWVSFASALNFAIVRLN